MKPQPTKLSAFADELHQTCKFDERSKTSAKADSFVGCGFTPPFIGIFVAAPLDFG